MNKKIYVITCLMLLLTVSACNYNYAEKGRSTDMKRDAKELSLAKSSLRLIAESKTDSLKLLLNKDVLINSKPEQLTLLFTNGKRTIENNEYPNDSLITVSYISNKTLFKEESFKEFNFPFINRRNPDSTMYFNIGISEGKIYKLFISTGTRMKKLF